MTVNLIFSLFGLTIIVSFLCIPRYFCNRFLISLHAVAVRPRRGVLSGTHDLNSLYVAETHLLINASF